MTTKQTRARSFYFAQLVADYFAAFGFYPSFNECRTLFLYSTRKARFY